MNALPGPDPALRETDLPPVDHPGRRAVDGVVDKMAEAAVQLGHDVVDIAGYLETVDTASAEQIETLEEAAESAASVTEAAHAIAEATDRIGAAMRELIAKLGQSSTQVSRAVGASPEVMGWVSGVGGQLGRIDEAMQATQSSITRILTISREVNMLSINAKIEAARAGANGRGFSVVADSIDALSTQTAEAARTISATLGSLAGEIAALRGEAQTAVGDAGSCLAELDGARTALERMGEEARSTGGALGSLDDGARQMRDVMQGFGTRFQALHDGVTDQVEQVRSARKRVDGLINLSETLVQDSYHIGGATEDRPLIEDVRARAATIGAALEAALTRGEISREALFSRSYRTVPDSDPPQVVAPFTALTDRILPQIQEPALQIDPRVIFCAAVDRQGYLPTHNRKFSARPGPDPVWNAAHCRNRRIFDDRVGLAAGRSTAPFLLQIYRRDMGGGRFEVMKDLSAPIFVAGDHWGGLRLAYRF